MTTIHELDTEAPAGEVARAATQLGVGRTIAFDVDGERFTYEVGDDGFVRREGIEDDTPTVVGMDRAAWDDVTGQVRTFINLLLADELDFPRGRFEDLADWDPALKLIHAGIPIYDPARVDLSAVDTARAFTPDASDDELRSYLETTGYLHVRGVFTANEIAAINAEVDRLAAAAREGDGRSWWVTTDRDTAELCRLVYATLGSSVIADLEDDPRVDRFGRLYRSDARLCADRMEGAAVLIKVPGKTQGLANIPWHQDCGMGGHAFMCPATAIGIQLTGSSAETGHFVAVPGSHGQTLHYRWDEMLDDVPVVSIDTEPGDITVHIQDLMHASPEPTRQGGRRTLYLTFYPPALWEHIGEGQAFNDLVRERQSDAEDLKTGGRS